MKLVTTKFKSGGLHESLVNMVINFWIPQDAISLYYLL